jgi:hypothetical protein
MGVLTKAATTLDIGGNEVSDELMKAEDLLFKGGCPEDDGVDYTIDEEPEEEEIDDVQKAEDVLNLGAEEMDLQKAEEILLSE